MVKFINHFEKNERLTQEVKLQIWKKMSMCRSFYLRRTT